MTINPQFSRDENQQWRWKVPSQHNGMQGRIFDGAGPFASMQQARIDFQIYIGYKRHEYKGHFIDPTPEVTGENRYSARAVITGIEEGTKLETVLPSLGEYVDIEDAVLRGLQVAFDRIDG